MKRSVAILGPTPQFVRWAIEQPCDLREIDCENLPDHSFRQLRGIREFSIGLTEDRVFENICVSPTASLESPSDCRGFHADEVLDAHGGATSIRAACDSCPANAIGISRPGVWAGCYGWLPAQSGFSFETALHAANTTTTEPGTNAAQFDFVEVMDDVLADSKLREEFESVFKISKPYWYGAWATPILSSLQVSTLRSIIHSMLIRCGANTESDSKPELTNLVQFHDALVCCDDHQLPMHVHLTPPGFSDGQIWTIESHCPDCKRALVESDQQQRCSACGRFGNPHGVRKSKVLGLRPYVHLAGVMGEEKAREFLSRYLKTN